MSRKRTHRRTVNPTAWASTILDRQPFSEAQATQIVNKVRVALQLLLDGQAESLHFITLGCAVNVASVRAEQIGDELVGILAKAGAAMTDAQRIHDTHGRYGLTGTGRQHLMAGIDAYEAILRESTPAQMQLAEREVVRRLGLQERHAPAGKSERAAA